jgi:hypothetical protein
MVASWPDVTSKPPVQSRAEGESWLFGPSAEPTVTSLPGNIPFGFTFDQYGHLALVETAPVPSLPSGGVAAFLPDQLRYRPGQPAHFEPGRGNGRGLHDDAFGSTLSLMVGRPLGVTTSPHPVVPEFPHLAPAGHDDLPALADMLGIREHVAKPPPG